jgi:adenylate cyclase
MDKDMIKERYKNSILKATFTYFISLWICVSAGLLFDSFFVLPLVEVDEALTIIDNGSSLIHSLRDYGTALIPPIIANLLIIYYIFPIFKFLFKPTQQVPLKVLRRVTKAPKELGFIFVITILILLMYINILDLIMYDFPKKGEMEIYILTTSIAIISSGVFNFMAVYLTVDYLSRRFMIPVFFPNGKLSTYNIGKPLTFTSKLLFLWIAVSIYPIIVLTTGYYPRGEINTISITAFIFSLLMIPIGALLVISLARSFHQPVQELAKATEQIAQGDFNILLKSEQNDELGYLMDQTVEMAKSLKEKEKINDTFGRAVDPRVRDYLLKGDISLGGERKEAAVLFCDIRGFTKFSELRDEEEVVTVLNEHLAMMEKCISEENGMINKFLGDGILALFGLPLSLENPAQKAVLAAEAMLLANAEMNNRLKSEGKEGLELGIGIHYGTVLAGNIGTTNRMEYTAIGDTVNLASRIQEFSKKYDGHLFVTEEVYIHLTGNHSKLQKLGKVKIRGREDLVNIWMGG